MNARNQLIVFIAASLLFSLLVPQILSDPAPEILTAKDSYGFGESIRITVESSSSVIISIEDPNGASTILGECSSRCSYTHIPRVIIEGRYIITSKAYEQILSQKEITISKTVTVPHEAPVKPEDTKTIDSMQEQIEQPPEIPPPQDKDEPISQDTESIPDSEKYLLLSIDAFLDLSEAEVSAERIGRTIRIIIIDRNAGDNIVIEAIDASGNLYVLNARADNEGRNIALLPSASNSIIVRYLGRDHPLTIVSERPLRINDRHGQEISATMKMLTKSGQEIDTEEALPGVPHDLLIIPDMTVMKRIHIKDIDPESITTQTLLAEDIPTSIKPGAIQAYAIDPRGVEFTEAEVTVNAKGTVLYKCVEYDFLQQDCYGKWTRLMLLTPGQDYTFILTPEDPAFVEGDSRGHATVCTFTDDPAFGTDVDTDCVGLVNSSFDSYADLDDGERTGAANSAYMYLTFNNSLYIETVHSATVSFRYMRETNTQVGQTTAYIDVWYNGGWTSACTDTVSVGSYETYTCAITTWITTEYEANNVQVRLTIDTAASGQPFQFATTRVDYVFLNLSYDERDVTAPTYSGLKASPASPATYSPSLTHWFNISWLDDFGISHAVIEHNFTGTTSNHTLAIAGSEYYLATSLGAGSYQYRHYANDTTDNRNKTDTFTYTVNRAAPSLALSLNGSAESITVNNSGIVQIFGESGSSEQKIEILKDGTVINSSYDQVSKEELFDAIKTYNITLRQNATQNYTQRNLTLFVHVIDTIPPGPVTDLTNASSGDSWIHFTWTDPILDYKHTEVWLNQTYLSDTSDSSYNMTGLNADTNYLIRLRTVDHYGNTGDFVTLAAKTRESDDTTPPKITNVLNSTTVNTALITWETDELADTRVKYGTLPGAYTKEYHGYLNVFSHSANITWLLEDTFYYYVVNSTDIAGNSNQTAERTFRTLPDTTPPRYSMEKLSHSSPTAYSPSTLYWFNISWIDDYAMGTARITHNFSGTLKTENMINRSQEYYYSTSLPAGTHTYHLSANDSKGLENETSQRYLTITKAEPALSLLLNGTSGNFSIPEDTFANITGSIITPETGSLTISIGGMIVASGLNSISNLSNYTNPGIINITLSYAATQNYTGKSITYWLIVRDTTAPIVTLNSPEEDSTDTDGYVPFRYYVEDQSSLANCSLVLDGLIDTTTYLPAKGNRTFTKTTMQDGIYSWNVICYDAAGNMGSGTSRTLNVSKNVIQINVSATTTSNWDDADTINIADINAADGTYETRSIARNSNRYILWTNFTTTLPNGSTIISVIYNVLHRGGNSLTYNGIEFWNGNSFIVAGCGTQTHNNNFRIDSCDISTLVNTLEKAKDIRTRYRTFAGNQNQNLDIDHIWVTINYVKETTPPLITLNSPGTDGTRYLMDTTVTLNYTVSESYLDFCRIYSNFNGSWGINYTDNNPINGLNSHSLTLPFGSYEWNVECYDQSGNSDNATRNGSFQITKIIGDATTIDATGGILPNITIDGSMLNTSFDYTGTRTVRIMNATSPLITFTHNFTESQLNLSAIRVVSNNLSVAAHLPDHDSFIMFVPLQDEQCNVLVCEGAFSKEECTAANTTLYPEPSNSYCNVTIRGTWAQDAPDQTDFLIREEDIMFPNREFTEGQNILFNATVTNDGNTRVRNLTVEFFDLTRNLRIALVNITEMEAQSTYTIRNISWIAKMGNTSIEVRVDPFNEYVEYDESNNNASKNINVSIWQIFYGHVFSNKTHGSSDFNVHMWEILNHSGNIYVAGSGRPIHWSSLQALGRDFAGEISSDDFIAVDIALGTTYAADSVRRMFSVDGDSPKQTMTLSKVEHKEILHVPYINSTNTSEFITGILWDMTEDTDGEYGQEDGEDLVFVTRINTGRQGKYGVYDFEIRVPAGLREMNGANGYVHIYLSLD